MQLAIRLCVLMCLVFAPGLFGQAFTSLSGNVSDPTGAVMAGATISLQNVDTQISRDTVSDDQGRYSYPQVQPGTYRILAKARGFADVLVNDVRLLVNSPVKINITFEKVGTVAETVSVSAEAVQLNTTDASVGNAIGTQAILQLPFFARNVAGLLAYQPGVTAFNASTTDDRNGAVNGGKSDQANVTLDGIDVNDQQNRFAFTSVLRVTLDSVQEFRTVTTGGNAEMGRSSGAQISLVTKNGSNDFHGSLYEYHRNTKTAANSFFNNLSGVKRPALLINVFGASIGGPVARNKLFFFLNYEGRRDASAANVARTVPSEKMRQGIIQYQSTAGGVRELAPADIRRIDPAGIGVNQASLQLLQSYPVPNDFALGDGLNILGYRFTAPVRSKQDTWIARFDYNLNNKHSLFLRGNLQNDRANGVPQFPGDPPASAGLENAKGYALGHTYVVTPSLVSTFRYGQTRQSTESTGIQTASAVTFRNLDSRFALTRGITRQIPVHHITQDFAWNRGAHDIRFGGTLRWTGNTSNNYGRSFHQAIANLSWLRGTGADLQTGVPDLVPGNRIAYGDAMLAVLGILTQGNALYNFDIKGSVLPVGAPISRLYKNEEFEMYFLDTWRVTRALTISAGLRWSLMPPVYEGNGVQTSAQNLSLGDWFDRRAALGYEGRAQKEAGLITYVLHNSAGGRPLYAFHKKNVAPRLSLAWSPQSTDGWVRWLTGGPGKTSIRAGWGMFYDLFGQPLIRTFDASAFGLATNLVNPAGQITSLTAPRFTGFYSLPSQLIRPAPAGGFPVRHPVSGVGSFAITNSIDDTIQPPYTINMNLTVGREFSRGLYIEGSYAARLSRKSLITRDLAMPTNLTDPQSGQTYFEAAAELARHIARRTPTAQVPRLPFFENFYSNAAGGGLTATQQAYNVYRFYPNDATSALADFDHFEDPFCGRLGCNMMFSSQFSALSALSSVAGGKYHGMQWTVRKRFGEGLTFDFNYTWSKSIDMSSNAERAGSFAGFLLNPFSPDQRVAVSDYDARHVYNAYMIWQLPFGKGRRFGGGSGRALDAVIGGWQITPSWNQSTELPVGVGNGRNWPTNWNITGFATPVGTPPVPTKTRNAPAVAGRAGPNLFADPKAALDSWGFTLPGQSGLRNSVRIDGGFNVSLGVAKRFLMPYAESHSVQFRWETFNLTNAVRFAGINMDLGNSGSFGKYTGLLNSPRQMQFALRYEF